MNSVLGVVSFDDRPPDEASLRKAAESLTGPKLDVGYVATECGGFLQARWTKSGQDATVRPITAEQGRFVILWDGRIDNRPELAALFGADSVEASRWGDAEYALRAYLRWGNACVSHILGDFAFAVWDERERRLFCARDPMGIRPFYYRKEPGRVVFGSDILPIVQLAHAPLEPNEGVLALYLRGMPGAPDETFITGVSQLPASHTMTLTKWAINSTRYWEPDPWSPIRHRALNDYVDHFLEVFDAAVHARLAGPQPVGISLSGGLDSTSIACTAATLRDQTPHEHPQLKAISSVFNDIVTADESEFVREVGSKTGIPIHYLIADSLWGWKAVEKSDDWWNQPYPIPFMARHEALLSAARLQGCSAVLTGEGGDELLYQGLPHLVDLIRARRLREFRHEFNHLVPSSKRAFIKSSLLWMAPAPVLRAYDRIRPKQANNPWLDGERVQQYQSVVHPVTPPRHRKGASLYTNSVYTGIVNIERAPFLSYLTEAYRRHGIEARHPFFDLRVIEFLSRIPPELKFQHGRSKFLLRQAMRQRVPDSILLRHGKTYFTDASLIGLRHEAPRLLDLIRRGYAQRCGWLDFSELERCFELAQAGHLGYASELARLISLELWAQQPANINTGRNNDVGAVSNLVD